jgi:Relaxase/Mobilisation nuclease domain
MVSIVESSRDTRSTLLYNEEKLEQNKAIFLGAFNYWQEDAQLTTDTKLQRLRDLTVLNERSQAKTIHFSLNFHPDEQLEDRKMRQIAREFLQKIDFGDQPALIYRHIDAGHPHAHIVTVNIRPDGSRIDNDKRSPENLREVCAELERRHSLMPAAVHHAMNHWREEQQYAQRLEYGKTPTKTGIETVLAHVLYKYNYTTLEELNAVLKLYHVQADRGSEYGQMYQSRGLYYRMIDENGVKVGAPIKASSLKNKPTLDHLEDRYLANRLTRKQDLERLKTKVWISLKMGDTSSIGTWKKRLIRERVEAVTLRMPVRRKHAPVGEEHQTQPSIQHAFDGHGFYYVDFESRTVFRDTELGPEYTAESILRGTGLDKQVESLALNRQLDLQPKQRAILEHANPDPRQKVRLLLELSEQHDQIVAHRLAQEQELRRKHRIRLSL